MKNQDKSFKFHSIGNSGRAYTSHLSTVTHFMDNLENTKIDGMFLAKNYELEGYCVWLSMAQLMAFRSPELAKNMIERMKTYPNVFNYLTIYKFKVSHDDVKIKMDDFLDFIQKNPTADLCKDNMGGSATFKVFFPIESKKDGISYKRHQLDWVSLDDFKSKFRGIFVAFLQVNEKKQSYRHAVVIDTRKGIIYDSEDSYMMRLNEGSLNLCTGDEPFHSIHSIYELQSSHDG